jgi:4-amino-4-deoxy-L-arabinose transferase-like glycosyltransferase
MRPARVILLKIFLCALAVRWIYVLALFAIGGEAYLLGVDSHSYVQFARSFAAAIAAGSVEGWQWLGPDPNSMPLFAWLTTLNSLAFGTLGPLAYVLMQGVFDSGTCLLVYGIARAINSDYARAAAIVAVINPTQIVMSGLVYPDTPFVFFVALFLYAAANWIRSPSPALALLIGVGLGGASLLRMLIGPWAIAMPLFLLIASACQRQLSKRSFAQITAAAAIIAMCIGLVLCRNVVEYKAWALTPQGGRHLALWIVPLVKEAQDGTPWARTYADIEARTRARFGARDDNPFEESRRYVEVGREAFATLDKIAVAKAWLLGAAINLGAPAIILSPPIIGLPRTGFYGTPGTSTIDKIGNFLLHSESAAYAGALLLGIAGVAIIRLLQLAGIFVLLKGGGNASVLLLFALWFGYVLMVNGPIASPKYRLPLEPLLAVLAGAGACMLRHLRTEVPPPTAA